MTNGTKRIGAILKKQPDGVPFRDALIEEVLLFCPKKEVGIVNMLVRGPDDVYHTTALYFTSDLYPGEPEDVSWKDCVRNLFAHYDAEANALKNARDAFRTAIFTTKKATFLFGNSSLNERGERVGQCVLCQRVTTPPSVDHYPTSFEVILQAFLVNEALQLNQVAVDPYTRRLGHQLHDQALTHRWILHHDQQATFRILCKQCNSACGQHGHARRRNQRQ